MEQLYNGDCYELIKNIPDNSIDLIVTDPPYLIESTKPGSKSNLSKSIKNMNNQISSFGLTTGINNSILKEFVRVLKKINIYIWCNHKQIMKYLNFFVSEYGCKFDIIIWNKTNASPLFNNKYLTDKEYCLYIRKGGYLMPENYEAAKTVYYQPINIKDKKLYQHPTIKPLNIIENLIKNSTKKGQRILDPFMGSGTTGVAAKKHKKDFIGIEIDKKFYDIAVRRINETETEKEIRQLKLFETE